MPLAVIPTRKNSIQASTTKADGGSGGRGVPDQIPDGKGARRGADREPQPPAPRLPSEHQRPRHHAGQGVDPGGQKRPPGIAIEPLPKIGPKRLAIEVGHHTRPFPTTIPRDQVGQARQNHVTGDRKTGEPPHGHSARDPVPSVNHGARCGQAVFRPDQSANGSWPASRFVTI